MWASNRTAAAALDSADPLAQLPDRYQLPPGVIRLDGNGAGPWTGTSSNRLRRFVEHRWHAGPRRRPAGERCDEVRATAGALAPLTGARPHELTISESSPVNLFTTLLAGAKLRPERPVLVVGHDSFATDGCLARSAAEFGGLALRVVQRGQPLDEVLDERVAVVALSHTDLATGALRDPSGLGEAAHRQGALALLDLTHSTGALAVDLRGWGTDLAIGGGDKYLGGGPGAPAYSFVAERHQEALAAVGAQHCRRRPEVANPLSSGLGVTPSMLGVADLRVGLSVLEGVPTAELERKAAGLVDLFLERTGAGVEVLSPPSGPRGSEVLLQHPSAHRVADGLFQRGVLVTVVEPDVLRFSFAPSWLRYVDVWEAAELLREVLDDLDRSGLSAPPG